MIVYSRRRSGLFLTGCLVLFFSPVISSSADMSVIERWMGTNKGLRTIRIDFTQTRSMKSIKVPIRQNGTLWLDYGTGQFRWQVGDPPQTIVTKHNGSLFIIRTPMKKFERRSADSGDVPHGLMAMATGFPQSTSDFQQKYSVQGIEVDENIYRIVTQPRGQAGRGVKNFVFVVGRDDYRLRGIEISLADGSFVNTAFNRAFPNVGIPENLFTPDITGYGETKF